MNGAVRHGPPPRAGRPDPALVHDVHDRYLVEVVEELGLCPFARRSRELGRVHRPAWWADGVTPTALDCARTLAEITTADEDAEIVLLTFIGDDPRFAGSRLLDAFVEQVRAAYAELDAPTFFMVGFHRDLDTDPDRKLTPDSLVARLRRTPDPVIQCVRASVLERVRATAQKTAHERMMAELSALDPAVAAIAKNSVQPDSELSADIARHNFGAVGTGAGRQRLEAKIDEILAARDAAY